MIRDIFVPIMRSGSDDTALDAAMALAQVQQAHVTALVTVENPMPMATEFGYVPVEVNQQMLDDARTAADALAVKVRARLTREAVASEVRISDSMLLWSEETAALQARYADLSVLGGEDPNAMGNRFSLTFKSLLLQSGRPVLLVPMGVTLNARPQRVVLAWQPTREATRALHDALPLLPANCQIDVLTIDPVVAEGGHGQQPGADIATHLARYGLNLRVVSLPAMGRSVGDNLLEYVKQVDADWLLMGGYGHSRWREAILGGTTRTVLDGVRIPVLFAH